MNKLTPSRQKIINAFIEIGIGKPATLEEVRLVMKVLPHEQTELTRRIRELEQQNGYEFLYSKKNNTYTLVSDVPKPVKVVDNRHIPGKLIAQILHVANGRCGMCGSTIAEDLIKLVIDHRVPYAWGGATDEENLWAICELCNIRKKDFISELPEDIMKVCMIHKETIKRLGELLKAYKGKVVPRSMLEIVGQDDEWTRRLRELRALGWKVERVIDTSQKGRYQHAYRLIASKPWPGNLSSAIKKKSQISSSKRINKKTKN